MADKDELARLIQERMNKRFSDVGKAQDTKDFLSKYADKMKAPAGMVLEDIPEETARLGAKMPKDLKRSMLSKISSAAGKAIKPAAGVASMLMQDELNPDGEIVENPDIPMEMRAQAAKAGEHEMRSELANKEDFEKRKSVRDMRVQALMKRLRETGE